MQMRIIYLQIRSGSIIIQRCDCSSNSYLFCSGMHCNFKECQRLMRFASALVQINPCNAEALTVSHLKVEIITEIQSW